VAVDFTTPDGQRIVRDLVRQSDVLVENYKVGGLAKYGLDYASVGRGEPRLVYASITGFGQNGPYADRAGYDFIIQGMSGFMSVTGERDDLAGWRPAEGGHRDHRPHDGDVRNRGHSGGARASRPYGEGQWIDTCLFDSAVAMMAVMNLNYLVTGAPPGRAGNAHQNIVPYQAFACADGHVILAVGNDSQFAKFCEAADRRAWAADERFAKNADRVRPPRHSRAARRGSDADADPARVARRRSRRSAFLADRSTASTRCLPIRNSRRAACGWICRILSPAACRRSGRRSGFR
jgi:formyl-CoA transferase